MKIALYDDNGKVTLITRKPTEYQLNKGVEAKGLPEPDSIEGKVAILYYSEDDGFYYKYDDRVLTKEEQQEQQVKALQETVDQLVLDSLMGGM